MKSKGIIGALSLLLIGIVFGAILVSGLGWVRPGLADLNLGANEPPVKLDADASSFSQAFIEVAEKSHLQLFRLELSLKERTLIRLVFLSIQRYA